MPRKFNSLDLRSRLIGIAVQLLAEHGPSALQVRAIAKAAEVSTMSVYNIFGGMPDLLRAVDEHGHRLLATAFLAMPASEDPVADIFGLALVYRQQAHVNPHLYDLMFGLSTRGAYRAIEHKAAESHDMQPAAYQLTYAHLVMAAKRLVESGRVRDDDPAVIAAQLWSFVHGFIALELAGHFRQFKDSVAMVLIPIGINMAVALGDTREQAEASIAIAIKRIKAKARKKTPSL